MPRLLKSEIKTPLNKFIFRGNFFTLTIRIRQIAGCIIFTINENTVFRHDIFARYNIFPGITIRQLGIEMESVCNSSAFH